MVVEISDDAAIDNRTRHDRTHSDGLNLNGLFGTQSLLSDVFPEGTTVPDLDLNSSLANDGRGRIDRNETINYASPPWNTRVAERHMVLFGRQEVRVNMEVREIVIGGVIRAADIFENTVSYDEMAEAWIAYGGRGQISDLQQQRYGAQASEILMPF